MNQPDHNPVDAVEEARMARLLRRLDESRKRGGGDSSTKFDDGLSPEEQEILRDAQDCLDLLDSVRPPDALNLAPATLAHYRLEERVGSGGMGQVFRATDLALGRTCALKILPPEFPASLKDRLLHEARVCARLQHPNIAAFYEAGEADRQAFIAMEFVAGQTLRQRLRNGALPTNDALSIAACLLNGLGHAHALGILHRDIKPENIMLVNERHAKFVDFGLAKTIVSNRRSDATVTRLTEEGTVVGTIGYMSPEQLRGETLDARSDLFSVGAVLYESLAGRPAFPGRNQAERMAAILATDPEPLAGSTTISQLNLVLKRALAKNPNARYTSAASFLNDLTLLASGGLRIDWSNALVVMDFENISGDRNDDWIGIGVAESLAADLGRIPGIDVKSRDKLVKHLKTSEGTSDSKADRQKVGLALGCRWMISGGYQRMGNALRFTITLNELLTDSDLITAKVDGTVDGIFELQDRLTELIRNVLQDQSESPANREAPLEAASRPTSSAYECYIKGRHAWLQSGKSDFDQAEEYFEQAIELDSGYAPAYAGLATVHALRFTYTTDSDLIKTTKSFAKKALELDAELSEAHVWLGYAYINENELQKAYAEELKATALDDQSLFGHYFAGVCLNASHGQASARQLHAQTFPGVSIEDPHRWRFERAKLCFQNALRLAPDHGWSYLGVSSACLASGELTESRLCLERATELDSVYNVPGVVGFLAETCRRLGQYDEARRSALNGLEAVDASDSMYRDTLRAIFLCSLGRAAFDNGDKQAAEVAFNQAVQHLRGRSRARGGGHTLVQALAGLALCRHDHASFEQAWNVWRNPGEWSFHYLPLCSADISLCALAKAACSLRLDGLAGQIRDSAIDYGSREAVAIPGDNANGNLRPSTDP